MLTECRRADRVWEHGINNDVDILSEDKKRLFSKMDIDNYSACGYNPTAVLTEERFGELLLCTTAMKGTGIMQLLGCASQIEHTDYGPGTRVFEGTSIPFGRLLALTPRSTYVLPQSHKLHLGQARVIVKQEPGNLLIMRGDLRHGGGSSIGKTFGLHPYSDRPGVRGGTHVQNGVHLQ
jgi:hypothetical protein